MDKSADNIFRIEILLANRTSALIIVFMDQDSIPTDSAEIAAEIAKFQSDELDRFLKERLRNRDLHQIVANLNEQALAKENPKSKDALFALQKLGFTD